MSNDLHLNVIDPDPAKSTGCAYCPLFPLHADFAEYQQGAKADHEAGQGDYRYKRDAKKIISALKDPHEVRTHGFTAMDKYPDPVEVLFVLPAPNGNEDGTGKPNAGRPGKLLEREARARVKHTHAFAYVAGCRTFRSKNPTKTVVKACAEGFLEQVEHFAPEMFVAVGATSLEVLTGQKGITSLHGAVLSCILEGYEDVPVLALNTAEYIIFADQFTEDWLTAISTIDDVCDGGEIGSKMGEYTVLTTPEEVEDMVDAFIEDRMLVAYDTETGRLNSHVPNGFPSLLCFTFTNEVGYGYCIPYDHVQSPWALPQALPSFQIPSEPKRRYKDKEKTTLTAGAIAYDAAMKHVAWYTEQHAYLTEDVEQREDDRARVTAALVRLFNADVPFLAQNAKFDQQHILRAIGTYPPDPLDTMLTHMTIDEVPGNHGLKLLAYKYTDMGGYDSDLDRYKKEQPLCDPRKGGSYACFPADVLFPYAAADTDCTLQCYHQMQEDAEYVDNLKLHDLAESFLPRLSDVLMRMEYAGATVDESVVLRMQAELEPQVRQLEADLAGHPVVLRFRMENAVEKTHKRTGEVTRTVPDFNPNSPTQLQKLFYGHLDIPPYSLTKTGEDTLTYRYQQKSKADATVEFSDVVIDAVNKKEWRHFATDAAALEEISEDGGDEGLVELILEYRKLTKLLGTYVEPMLTMRDADSRIHGRFNPTGAATGRLSSSQPNLQNIPGSAKHAYVSRHGKTGMLLQADYSQVELRIAASWFNEPEMLKAYVDCEDLHMLTAIDISKLSPEAFAKLPEKERKGWRTRAKRINFGILYGAGPPALRKTLKKDGVHITEKEAQRLIRDYFAARKALKRGLDGTQDLAQAQGYLETYTGRRRRLPAVKSSDRGVVSRALRQSTNFPIQSGASDMTLLSLVLIDDALREGGFKSILILTVHDSIILDCPEHEVTDVAKIVTTIMETVMHLAGDLLPLAEWDWLKCPIVADVEAGRTWGAMVGFHPDTVQGTGGDDDLYWYEEGALKSREPQSLEELLELSDKYNEVC